ncbi:MAG TPA: patatin-like phospholipase family protein [bacterium]|nr:patatin-like phospholipase family protein [bacterium]
MPRKMKSKSIRIPKEFQTLNEMRRVNPESQYKVGLALCGGVAYGVAQIGVLKALEKAGIKIDCLAGTSAGAIIAAAYASGLSVSRIEEIGINTNWGELFSFRPSRKGLVSSGPIEKYIRNYLKVEKFEQLKKPLAVVATDICSGEEVIFTQGALDKAVRASCSIPGVYVPVEMEGRQLVDGGMAENVPVKALKSLGADVVIAVNLFGHHQIFPPASNVFQILMRVWYFFVEDESAWREQADIILEPDMRMFDLFDFGQGKEIIAEGEREANAKMAKIKQVIQRRTFFRPEIYR